MQFILNLDTNQKQKPITTISPVIPQIPLSSTKRWLESGVSLNLLVETLMEEFSCGSINNLKQLLHQFAGLKQLGLGLGLGFVLDCYGFELTGVH